jgi:hypothetical protein
VPRKSSIASHLLACAGPILVYEIGVNKELAGLTCIACSFQR